MLHTMQASMLWHYWNLNLARQQLGVIRVLSAFFFNVVSVGQYIRWCKKNIYTNRVNSMGGRAHLLTPTPKHTHTHIYKDTHTGVCDVLDDHLVALTVQYLQFCC